VVVLSHKFNTMASVIAVNVYKMNNNTTAKPYKAGFPTQSTFFQDTPEETYVGAVRVYSQIQHNGNIYYAVETAAQLAALANTADQ
jgi:hypothetical protein